jgi:hypothetical protein
MAVLVPPFPRDARISVLTRLDTSVFSKGTFPEVSSLYIQTRPARIPNDGGVSSGHAQSQTASTFGPALMTMLPSTGVPHRIDTTIPARQQS